MPQRRQPALLSDREILIAGAIAYWCEGSKSKPIDRRDDVSVLLTAILGLILFFMRFLAVAGVTADRLICRVAIHESADIQQRSSSGEI